MRYKFENWNKKSGTIPVTWTISDYTVKTDWFQHPGSNNGFDADRNLLEIYSQNIGVMIPQKVPSIFDTIKSYFDLENIVLDLSKYRPGMILPWHKDTYPTYSKNMNIDDTNNIVRIIVFLHDANPGEQLWIEEKFCTGQAGCWFSWTGKTEHMAANLGKSDRYVIQLTGVMKN